MLKSTKWYVVAFLSSFGSLGFHGYLAVQHFLLKYGLAHEKSVCTLNATFNCDVVAMSPYSVLLGYPLALWGFATHLVLCTLILGAMLGLSANSGRVLRFAQILGALTFAATIVMATISLTLMKAYCLFCIGAYALSILIVIALFAVERPRGAELGEDFASLATSDRWIAVLFLCIPGLTVFGQAVLKNRFGGDRFQYMVKESITNWKAAPVVPFDLSKGLRFSGGAEPRFTIVEFADFKCPHCKVAAPTLHGFVASRPDAELVFKAFPLDGGCNPEIQQAGDGLRCKLASLVFCADKLGGKGWPANEWAFENQERTTLESFPSDVSELAKANGLGETELKACIEAPETGALLKDMAAEGGKGKIRGTPAIFVNGRSLEAGQVLEVLTQAYENR